MDCLKTGSESPYLRSQNRTQCFGNRRARVGWTTATSRQPQQMRAIRKLADGLEEAVPPMIGLQWGKKVEKEKRVGRKEEGGG